MFIKWEKARIFIRPGHTDMRKQINSLSILMQEQMKTDPFGGSFFAFCNKRRNRLKILYWDKNGFCLWMKRLEQDKFPWPSTTGEAIEITAKELEMILDGIDFFNAHKILKYSEIF